MDYLIIFIVPLLLSLLMTQWSRRLSLRWGMVAEPGGRRKHTGNMPKLGGVAIFVAYGVGILLIYGLHPPQNVADGRFLRGVIIGAVVVMMGGLIDDRWDIAPGFQFGIQFLATAIAMGHEIFIERFTNPLPGSAIWEWGFMPVLFTLEESLVIITPGLVWVLTLFWVVGMMNTVNWLDGLDGLSAGVCTIAALLFAWHSFRLQQETVPLFPLALAGATIGFLFFNFAPAKIFLGTAGAYLLGYNMATLSIISPAKLSTALLVLAVPILDVAWQIFDRLRRGQNPLQGDRGHLHFRLSDGGLPTRRIVLGYYVVASAFGLIPVFVPSPLLKIVLWLGLIAAVLLLLIWLTARTEKGRSG